MDQANKVIRIESCVLFGETKPTHFVDLVTFDAEGRSHSKNLCNSKDAGEMRALAMKCADKYGAHLEA